MSEQMVNNSGISALCHVCRKESLVPVPGYGALSQVTSDCKPWHGGSQLCLCRSCGCVQKIVNREWLSETEAIYAQYSIYHQGNGSEQQVFENDSGMASSRSHKLLEHALPLLALPQTGRFLDVGCGNGAMLRSFQSMAPEWRLAGTELNDKYRSEIEGIAGKPVLYTCTLPEIPETFDMISMLHLLEHIIDPQAFLADIRNKLAADGTVLIEVPDYLYNPFDLLIADHCSHFSKQTLEQILVSAGFDIVSITTEWIPKELSVIARKSKLSIEPVAPVETTSYEESLNMLNKRVQWLQDIAHTAKRLSTQGHFGIFGTSIAGTWLYNEAGGANFFVDEDIHRIGQTYMGKPIYHPADVPVASNVFLAQPPEVTKNICSRLSISGRDITFTLPPEI